MTIDQLSQSQVDDFFSRQLSQWPTAAARFKALNDVATKQLSVDGFTLRVQFNPSRIVSSAANVTAGAIAARPCFLCAANRPAEQHGIDLGDATILVNPFPILPFHLTIVGNSHAPQLIAGHESLMARLALKLNRSVVFYNGPRCGASAPDHFHFQAVGLDSLPLIDAVNRRQPLPFGVIVFDATADEAASRLQQVMSALPRSEGDTESPVNILAYAIGDKARFIVIPRRRHRPDFYGSGDDQMLVSPASIDLAGVMVNVRPTDFNRFDVDTVSAIYSQLCYPQSQLPDYDFTL
jgi:ATP adenylyltransferase/5',5'''-P-1,P-4-tetraphosphate phosphorylase II